MSCLVSSMHSELLCNICICVATIWSLNLNCEHMPHHRNLHCFRAVCCNVCVQLPVCAYWPSYTHTCTHTCTCRLLRAHITQINSFREHLPRWAFVWHITAAAVCKPCGLGHTTIQIQSVQECHFCFVVWMSKLSFKLNTCWINVWLIFSLIGQVDDLHLYGALWNLYKLETKQQKQLWFAFR